MSQADESSAATSTDGLTVEELRPAARNHGLPLEALRHPLTPVGLHYLLVHYDIPVVDPATWRLQIGGAVERPLSLSLDELRERPAVTVPVTLECAGNGRALLSPRPLAAVADRGGRHGRVDRRAAGRPLDIAQVVRERSL